MEANKYYTPSIEEFHVGFEYEEYQLYTSGRGKDYKVWSEWTKYIATGDLIAYVVAAYHQNPEAFESYFRVKHLDKSDIESLGFIKNHLILEDKRDIWITFNGSSKFEIYDTDNTGHCTCRFNGNIKNKSEFKKLLKQLGI